MNYPVSTKPELAEIEKKYGEDYDDLLTPTVPIRTSRQRLVALRAHTARPTLTPPSATHYLYNILSHEVMHAEKGVRPGHIVTAERSLEQIYELSHGLAQLAIESPDAKLTY